MPDIFAKGEPKKWLAKPAGGTKNLLWPARACRVARMGLLSVVTDHAS